MENDYNWKIDELQRAIAATKYPQSQKDKLQKILTSVCQYVDITGYHIHFIQGSLERYFLSTSLSPLDKFLFVARKGARETEFREALLSCRAHLISAVNAARNAYDILSHLINLLVFSDDPIEEGECNIHLVKEKLSKCNLKLELKNLLASAEWKYLADFSNTIKHRHFIPINPRFVVFDESLAPIIESFEFKGRIHTEKNLGDALQQVVAVHQHIIPIGRALNALVSVQAV